MTANIDNPKDYNLDHDEIQIKVPGTKLITDSTACSIVVNSVLCLIGNVREAIAQCEEQCQLAG